MRFTSIDNRVFVVKSTASRDYLDVGAYTSTTASDGSQSRRIRHFKQVILSVQVVGPTSLSLRSDITTVLWGPLAESSVVSRISLSDVKYFFLHRYMTFVSTAPGYTATAVIPGYHLANSRT